MRSVLCQICTSISLIHKFANLTKNKSRQRLSIVWILLRKINHLTATISLDVSNETKHFFNYNRILFHCTVTMELSFNVIYFPQWKKYFPIENYKSAATTKLWKENLHGQNLKIVWKFALVDSYLPAFWCMLMQD